MRRRILGAIVAVTAVAVALFGFPLALAVQHLYRSEAVVRLEREATRATTAVPADFPTATERVELPAPEEGTTLAVYRANGRLVAGVGPAAMDQAARAARAGRVAERSAGGLLVVAVPVADEERVIAVVRAALPEAAIDRRVRRSWLLMAALGLGALAVAALVARLQSVRLSRPIDALALAAARLGEGDFSVRAGRSGVAEVDAVARTLDATGERLGRLLTRERAFSADASHQLRTSLAGLRLRLEAADLLPRADQQQAIADSLVEVDRLEVMVEQFLALARDVMPARDRLELDALLQDVERSWHGRLAAAGRPLRCRVQADLLPVHASAAAVRQILDVLVDNAMRHGAGAVTVLARSAPGGLAVEVGDQGPGVTGNSERVFARRAGAAPTRGIGLALARSLAEAEGGRLLLQRPGPGPVFTLLLPAERPAGPPATDATAQAAPGGHRE
jgi:signal transduction histidine kinase